MRFVKKKDRSKSINPFIDADDENRNQDYSSRTDLTEQDEKKHKKKKKKGITCQHMPLKSEKCFIHKIFLRYFTVLPYAS
jgi:hypothetical protein